MKVAVWLSFKLFTFWLFRWLKALQLNTYKVKPPTENRTKMVLIFLRKPTEEKRCSCLIWCPQWKVIRRKKRRITHMHFHFGGGFCGIASHHRGNPQEHLSVLLRGAPAEKRKSWSCLDTQARISSYGPDYAKMTSSPHIGGEDRFADYLVCKTYLFIYFPLILSLKTVIPRCFASSYCVELAGLYSCN